VDVGSNEHSTAFAEPSFGARREQWHATLQAMGDISVSRLEVAAVERLERAFNERWPWPWEAGGSRVPRMSRGQLA
jgi:hypothetical protein